MSGSPRVVLAEERGADRLTVLPDRACPPRAVEVRAEERVGPAEARLPRRVEEDQILARCGEPTWGHADARRDAPPKAPSPVVAGGLAPGEGRPGEEVR